MAVFRPSNGTWYVRQTSAGPAEIPWGVAGDLPVPAAYGGARDLHADVAVFRPSTGTWYLRGAMHPTAYGTDGDVPATMPYPIQPRGPAPG